MPAGRIQGISRLTCATLAVALSAACGGGGANDDGTGPVVATSIDLAQVLLPAVDCQTGSVQAAAYNDLGQPVLGVVFTYASTSPAVVTVTQAGVLLATGAGQAYVRATAGSLADSVLVVIADSAVIRLNTVASDLSPGQSDTLELEERDCRGALRASPAVTFTATDPAVASVSPSGIVTAVAPGVAYVRAAWANGSDSADVWVGTHPAGTLGTATPVASAPFGVRVTRGGQVLVTQHQGQALAVLPAGGGGYQSVQVGVEPTDVTTTRDGTRAFVTNQFSSAVGLVSLASLTQVGSVPSNMDPYRVLRSHDGRRIYVTGNGQVVQTLDAATGQSMGQRNVVAAQNGLAESPSGQFLYLSSMTAGGVRELNRSTGAIPRTFPTSGVPQEVVLTRDGATLFVAAEGTTSILAYDLTTGQPSTAIPVGESTFGMALSPDGQRLYATSPGTGNVHIIDPAARTVLTTVPVGGTPRRVAFSPDGLVAVVANEAGWVDFIN